MRRLGRVAQLAERAPEKREVTGSTPVPTTAEVQFEAGGSDAGQRPAGDQGRTGRRRQFGWSRTWPPLARLVAKKSVSLSIAGLTCCSLS